MENGRGGKEQASDPARGALAGVRVLDATQMLAGPICSMRLGDLGADVLKIEAPGAGEFNRTHGFAAASTMGGEMTTFLAVNRNKRSVTVDLKHPEGLETFHDLVRHSDVFVQNFRVGTAARLGVGAERLLTINPRLVCCSISGYGEEGPYRTWAGQDLIVQGYSGSMWSVGAQDDPPIPSALWAADVMTGYQAAIGILAALQARHTTGRGQKVEVNMLSVVMDAQVQELVTYLNLGLHPERGAERTAHALIPAPYGVYETADGYLTLSMSPLSTLGEALADDRLRAFTEYTDGFEHADEVYRIVRSIIPRRTTADWIEIFERHKV